MVMADPSDLGHGKKEEEKKSHDLERLGEKPICCACIGYSPGKQFIFPASWRLFLFARGLAFTSLIRHKLRPNLASS